MKHWRKLRETFGDPIFYDHLAVVLFVLFSAYMIYKTH